MRTSFLFSLRSISVDALRNGSRAKRVCWLHSFNFLTFFSCTFDLFLVLCLSIRTLSTKDVTYWLSTEPSIKKQLHPAEYIGILLWRVDVVEFVADAYAHRKLVDVKQLYNQMPQTAWVQLEFEAGRVQFELVLQFEFQSQLGTRCRCESQRQTEGLGPQDPGWAAQQNEEEVLL